MGTKACEDCYRLSYKTGLICTKHVAEREASLTYRVAVLEGLLTRVVKYTREDRAVTPGKTRLARLIAEIERVQALHTSPERVQSEAENAQVAYDGEDEVTP